MTKLLSKSQIKQIMVVLDLHEALEKQTQYRNYYGDLVCHQRLPMPFLTRADDLMYKTREVSKPVAHDGSEPNWESPWEEYFPRFQMVHWRRVPPPTRRVDELRYYKRLFSIPDATYIITEVHNVIDRVFILTDHPDFEFDYVLGCLREYRELNPMPTPARNTQKG